MRTAWTWFAALALLGAGYIVGASGILAPALLLAQGEEREAPSAAAPAATAMPAATQETLEKVKTAYAAVKEAMEALEQEQLYTSVTKVMNVSAVLSGGVDAMKDLETGRGVDPETFAALYAGQATDEIAAKLTLDADKKLAYNNRTIRMYPISRIKKMYATRDAISGEHEAPGSKPAAKPATAEEPEAEAEAEAAPEE